VSIAALRKSISHVPQRIDLLSGTILENLAPNDLQPDLQRLNRLCEQVGILYFIEALPRGFQTLIHENGSNLSGGQKQGIAVVRALYADAPIVLMDEPSSAMDPDSEEMLMTTLKTMRNQRKLVILAVHNQCLLEISDQVVEMANGEILQTKSPRPTGAPQFSISQKST
jgi:ABC-type bacteriocin/lantibiotic exporter with double-glycine peptidase domain